RRPPGLLQADPRVPELGRGSARAAEAERARELGASCERRCAGVGAPAPLRFGAAGRWVLGRASRSAPHRRCAGAPTPALRSATVLNPPPEGTGYAAVCTPWSQAADRVVRVVAFCKGSSARGCMSTRMSVLVM